tara:strand:- start:83 stop:337 length:255 start_codon:yes stop_codon:yes gene_type:complete
MPRGKIDKKTIDEIAKKFEEMETPVEVDNTIYQKEEDLPRAMTIDTTTSITGTSQGKKPAGKVFNLGGEVTIGKGSDYIKDLID